MARRPRRGNRRGGRPIRRPRIRGRTLPHTRPPPRGGRRPPMIPVKDREGIARMREVCAIAATVLDSLKPLVRPGVTTMDLEEAGRAGIARLGARSACYGYEHGERHYPAHTCISVNEEVVHGIPSFKRVLREGDIVSLDVVPIPERMTPMASSCWSSARERKKKSIGSRRPRGATGSSRCSLPWSMDISLFGGITYTQPGRTIEPSFTC